MENGELVKSPGSIQLQLPLPLSQALLQEFSQQTQSSGISDPFVPRISVHSEIRHNNPFQNCR